MKRSLKESAGFGGGYRRISRFISMEASKLHGSDGRFHGSFHELPPIMQIVEDRNNSTK